MNPRHLKEGMGQVCLPVRQGGSTRKVLLSKVHADVSSSQANAFLSSGKVAIKNDCLLHHAVTQMAASLLSVNTVVQPIKYNL